MEGGRRDRAWRLEMTAEEGPPNADAVEAIIAGENVSAPGTWLAQEATATATAAVPDSVRPILWATDTGCVGCCAGCDVPTSQARRLMSSRRMGGLLRAECAHTQTTLWAVDDPWQLAVDEFSCVPALLLHLSLSLPACLNTLSACG